MIELDESTRSTHKESSKVRVQRDENDIKKVIHVHTLKTVMSDPFYEDAYSEDFSTNEPCYRSSYARGDIRASY